MVFGKHDAELAKKEMEKYNRIQRIKAVRQQESLASQQTVQNYHKKLIEDKEEEEKQKQYQEYLKKLAEIEKLKKLRDTELQNVGKAQQAAEEAERKRLE